MSSSGGSVAEAKSSCGNSITIDYPSFNLSGPGAYQLLVVDAFTQSALQSGWGLAATPPELCATPPGVLYLSVQLLGGNGGPTITFGATGPSGTGGSISSPQFVSGRTYTLYGDALNPPFGIVGSTTLAAQSDANGATLSGNALWIFPPAIAFPSPSIGEIEVCYPN